jgi:hypothetical protein
VTKYLGEVIIICRVGFLESWNKRGGLDDFIVAFILLNENAALSFFVQVTDKETTPMRIHVQAIDFASRTFFLPAIGELKKEEEKIVVKNPGNDPVV